MKIPDPKPGMVISYSYLWAQEHDKGQEEGLKDRPCAIVSAVDTNESGALVTIVPITHTPPQNQDAAIEIPIKTKERLGLNYERSWIVCSEINQFEWPGPDLRPISRKAGDKCAYGFLPPKLFQAVKTKILYLGRGRALKVIKRSD